MALNILPQILIGYAMASYNTVSALETVLCSFTALAIAAFFIWLFQKKSIVTLNFKTIPLVKLVKTTSLAMVLSIVCRIPAGLLMKGETSANQQALNELAKSIPVILFFIMSVIFAPIVEEYIFRGFIQGYALKNYPKIGFALSTLLFTLIHSPNNLGSFLLYSSMAIILCALYTRTKRLEYTISLHFFNNFIAVFPLLILQFMK
jgi:membrane protease YdiL (CAAX protease family)